MPDFDDADAFLAALFGEADLIGQPPRMLTGWAATQPHHQAQMEADQRAAASPELNALRAGGVVGRVIDLDAPGWPELELPRIAWDWEFRWQKSGRLIMRDHSDPSAARYGSQRTKHFLVVAFTRRPGTEAPEAVDPAIPSPAAQEEALAASLALDQVRKLTPEQTKQRHKQARNYRKKAVAQIRADDKVPGTPNYPEDEFVREVRALCGLHPSESVRGFHRTTLGNLFKSLKKL